MDLLDIGTGPGWIPAALAKARPDWKISALDASKLMLEKAQAHAEKEGRKEITFIHGFANDTNLPSEQFDLVISHFAFHEFAEAQSSIREMERLVKPGGCLVIQDLQRPADWQIKPLVFFVLLANMSRDIARQYHQSLLASYRVDEIERVLERSGLIFSVEVLVKWAGGILRVIASKPINQSRV